MAPAEPADDCLAPQCSEKSELSANDSAEVWDETEDLRVASSSDSAVLELDPDGTVRYVSPTWDRFNALISNADDLIGVNIRSIVAGSDEDRDVFVRAMQEMGDESVTVRFAVQSSPSDIDQNADLALQLEAQGILVKYLEETHAVWVVSPYVPRPPVSVQLPPKLVKTTGFATQVFADFLEKLAAAVRSKALAVPAPPQELCRICERFIKTWWFERHHWLCTLEHKAEQRVLRAQERLLDQRELVRLKATANYNRSPSPKRASAASSFSSAPRVSSPLASPSVQSNIGGLTGSGDSTGSPSPARKAGTSPGLTGSINTSATDLPGKLKRGAPAGSDNGSDIQSALLRLLSRCDVALSLEIPNSTEEEPIPLETEETLAEIRKWTPLSLYETVDKEAEDCAEIKLIDETSRLIEFVASAIELMGSIVRYSATLWHEVELQVKSTIEATVLAAESNAETVTIDPEIAGETGDSSSTDPDRTSESGESNDEGFMREDKISLAESSSRARRYTNNSDIDPRQVLSQESAMHVDSGLTVESSRLSFSQAYASEVDHDAESALVDDPFDFSKHHRRRTQLDTRPSLGQASPGSPRLSPRMSPRVFPNPSSPRLSPRLWPASPASSSLPPLSSYALTSNSRGSVSTGQFPGSPLDIQAYGGMSQSPMLAPGTPPGRRSFASVSAARAQGLSLSSVQRRLSSATTASASSDDLPSIGRPSQPTIRDYEVLKPISKGAYGVVYLTRKKLTGELFAIKVLSKSTMVAKNQVQHVRAERQILMNTASSPYVATLYYTFQSRDYLYLVMEFIAGGDCGALLKQHGCFSEEWSRRYVAEIVVAVDSLHGQGALHRDLKPDNFLIDSRGRLKLSDFGLSTSVAIARADPDAVAGTPDYLAPETIVGEPQNEETDWWSLGCITYELLYGFPPFNDETPSKIMENILSGRLSFPVLPPEQDISHEARDFIKRLLERDPSARLDSEGIRKHPWLSSIRWNRVGSEDGPFIPTISSPTSTDNFDDRGAASLPPQDWDNPDIEFMGGAGRRSRRSSSQSSSVNYSGAFASGSLGSFTPNSKSGGQSGDHSGNSTSPSTSATNIPYQSGHQCATSEYDTIMDQTVNGFGSFSYRNLSVLEKANASVITKLRSEPRRLSMGSPVSPASPASTMNTLSEDDTSVKMDVDVRNAALERVRRRQQLRKSFGSSTGANAPNVIHAQQMMEALDVLVCCDDPGVLSNFEQALRSLNCHVIAMESGEEAIRRLTSGVQFDLILLAIKVSSFSPTPSLEPLKANVSHLSTPSTPGSASSSTPRGGVNDAEVTRIVRGTLNPNVDTPIVAPHHGPGISDVLNLENCTTQTGLIAELNNILKRCCEYEAIGISS